ncbi:MAG: flagellar basal body rod protein FlgB [Deltaproteobacteria bacterium]|nr:MAG: flagellar basal body rod protein FlgB [Deltaproteobacteria bacterium]
MMWESFTDKAMQLLEKSLNWRVRQQEIIAGNIANLDTPNFKRKEMDFQNILESYSKGNSLEMGLVQTDPGHIRGPKVSQAMVEETSEEVDLDQEMVRMADNQISYNASVQMLIKKCDFLRTVIEGDRK